MAEGISSFWGPVTSAEWCEKNYVYSSYIAEFFNTISNIPGILLALVGLINAFRQRFEKRFSILHISNMILAIGIGLESKSCPLHGTFPVCENSKTKNPVTGAAKQMASFPLHFVWWQMYGFGRGSNMPKRHGGAQWAAAAYVTVANLIGSVQRLIVAVGAGGLEVEWEGLPFRRSRALFIKTKHMA
ncbi:hypothetical protein D5086_030361 [Populus alba]|uniref:Uncharacterized protein n=1 Tax=Populus alba TaxID=43335 RepID=A0ACC4ANG8_POPAL